MVEIISILSSVISFIAVFYLMYIITTQTAKGLRTGFFLMAIGILVGIAIHSLAESFQSLGFLGVELLIQIMPVLILIGSLLILAGVFVLFKTFQTVSENQRK